MTTTVALKTKKADATIKEPNTNGAPERVCYVVGIGASEGGQEALEQLFTSLPSDCGLSFVVVMHLPADGPSFLAEMLGRYTTMEVVTAEEGMLLRPDTVHVIPAGWELSVQNDRLLLEKAGEPAGTYHPIDRFFRSLAVEFGERVIALVLSGFGTDGTAGVKDVKKGGGVVMVQEPRTAINPSMPRSAIATGSADFILPADEMPAKIAEIARGDCILPARACRVTTFDEDLETIFSIVKASTGHDFSSYKNNTIMRRIERRMAVNDTAGIGRYIALLRENSQEAHALCQDILIGVTSFFRDPEAFEVIRREVLPRIFANRSPDEPVRIWHACCASGEEVYSMAMLVREYLSEQKLNANVLIFATDIDEVAIAQARSGLYDDIEEDVGAERLKTFFTRRDGRWQAAKPLREMIVFAHHSLIKDPPFSHLDLLVCRNFLIYLNSDMQKRLIALFHQVLKPGGTLFLGGSETVGRNSELFASVDKKWKIFERREGERRQDTHFPFSASVPKLTTTGRSRKSALVPEAGPGAIAERLLMERYSPPCVVVNEKYDVVYVSTRTSRFLEVPVGEPTRDLLKMAREELRPALRAAIYKAFAEQQRVDFRGVKFVDGNVELTVNVVVEPLDASHSAGKLAMVIFEQADAPLPLSSLSAAHGGGAGDEASRDMLVRQLEEQLRVTHEQLHAATEQLETSNEGFMSANEELMSINEEFQSANEELQSTNEELETSREELQALNEELVTVNAELQGKVEELNQANSDMENLLTSSGIATLFLDRALNIKGFTPAAADIFNLIQSDIGRPFRHFAGKIDWSTLAHDAETVLSGQPCAEREVASLDKELCYLKRIFPYRTLEGSVDGIVVTFIDITDRKRVQDALAESQERVRLKLESILSPEGDIGNLELGDIIDAPALQLLVNDFYELSGMPMGLIDINGKVLVGVGWQEVCTKFHRVNPEACRNCLESDVYLSAGVPEGEYKVYKCKNNMWDVATPVMVGDRHFGNLFMGQFFFEDEPVDYEFFRSQARQYGFDESAYIAALDAVPRLSKETLNTSMSFFMKLAGILSKLSYSNIKLARSLEERNTLMGSLRDSEKQLKLFIEHAPAALAMFDTDMRYLSVSRRWLSDYNLGERDLIGEYHYDVFPEITEEWREAHRRGLAGEELRAEADRFARTDGSVQWVRWEIRPWHNAAGNIGGIVIFAEDVTDIIKAQDILRRYELLARHSRDIILFVRRNDGCILEANHAAMNSYGYDREELLGLSIKELRTPESVELTADQMAEADTRGILFETVHRRKDGTIFPVEISSQGATIDGTRILISVIRDITERKQAEEVIRKSEEQFSTLADSIPNLAWWANGDGYITWYNRRWYEYTGTTPEQMEGWGWQSVHDPKVLPIVLERWQATIATGQPFEMEFPLRGADGVFRTFLTRVVPLKDSAGLVLRWFGTNTDISAMKQAEEALRESEARLRRFYESELLGVIYWNMSGEVTDANDKFLKMLGYGREELLAGRIDWVHMTPPEYRHVDRVSLRELKTTGVNKLPYEKEFIRKDGSRIPVIIAGAMLDEARFNGVAFVLDITVRKRAEERLWVQARTLKALNSGNHALLHATDELSLLQAVCRTVAEDCGHAMVWIGYAEEDEEKSVRPVAHTGFDEGYLESLNITWADSERGQGPTGTAIRTGKPCGCSDMLSDPAFEPWRNEALKRGYVSSLVLPLMDNSKAFGALTIYSAKPNAFTEEEASLLMQLADELAYGIRTLRLQVAHEQAEETLSAYYRRQNILADTAGRLLAADSPQQIVDSLCQKVMEFLDCHTFFNFLVDEDEGRLHLNACAGIPEEEKQKIEWLDYGVAVCGCAAREACRIVAEDIFNTPDPRTELVKSYGIQAYACHPLMAQGRVLGTLSFGTRSRNGFSSDDLTLMKAVADQVAIAMERKRAEEELLRAKEAAEAATRAKSQFLANMSHELRNPMTGVLGMLDLVLEGTLDEQQREFLGMARNSGRSLLHILNDILDLTKVESGKLVIKDEPFALQAWLAQTADIFIPEARRKGIELLLSATDDLPLTVVGDQVRLRQVLTNLIGNAVKFTEQGRVEVRVVKGATTPDNRREFSFTVTDTGIGIPRDRQHLLFDSFSQIDDSNTRSYGGTGLGLAISREIVQLMGGTISFESEEGAGSAFSFTVPLKESTAPCDTVAIPGEASTVTAIVPTGKDETTCPRLLIAEDDHTNRTILGQVLKTQNFEVDFAENGCMAVEMWEDGSYDLIIMDVQMPLMDGFEATRAIREKERAVGGHVTIVALTAHAFTEDEGRCLDAGMDAYLSKPINLAKSVALIRELTQKKTTPG